MDFLHNLTSTMNSSGAPPEVDNSSSTIPKRELTTPAEHLSDFPDWIKSQKTDTTSEVLHEERGKEHFKSDMAAHRMMNSGIADDVDAIQSGRAAQDGASDKLATAERPLGPVEPKRIRSARENS